jgi:hypothetical protein
MKNLKISFLVFVVLVLSFLFIKNYSNQKVASPALDATVSNTEAQAITPDKEEENITNTPAPKEDAQVVVEKKDPDAFLKEKGFQEDPNNPDQLIKKTYDPTGKPVTFYVQKNSVIETNNITEKSARETLESKRDLDPNFEYENMNSFDDKNGNDSLLSGSFKNEQHDIELKILMTYEDTNFSLFDGISICFSAPQLNIEIPFGTKIDFKADGSGYGLAKLNDNIFLRLAWSMDPKRLMHGQIIKNSSSESKILLNFQINSVNSLEGKSLKRCVSKKRS